MRIIMGLLVPVILMGAIVFGEERELDFKNETRANIQEWQTLRYGMFIHYGMSTFTGCELDSGDSSPVTYAPTLLDVDQWIRVAHDAGMNYAVLTAKHVAGHCLWDSKVQWKGQEFDYDVATSGDKTDVVGGFVNACKKHGVMPGLYYCLMDGPNGLGHKTWKAEKLEENFFRLVNDQLEELLTRYPEVRYLWIDIPRVASLAQRTSLYEHIKGIAPRCIVLLNHGTTAPPAMAIADFQAAWPTDILNTERHPASVGRFVPKQSFQGQDHYLGYEHCDTICKHWFSVENDRPRPTQDLLALYNEVDAAGGNLLLNVPPDRTGRIPDCHIEALMELKAGIEAGGGQ